MLLKSSMLRKSSSSEVFPAAASARQHRKKIMRTVRNRGANGPVEDVGNFLLKETSTAVPVSKDPQSPFGTHKGSRHGSNALKEHCPDPAPVNGSQCRAEAQHKSNNARDKPAESTNKLIDQTHDCVFSFFLFEFFSLFVFGELGQNILYLL